MADRIEFRAVTADGTTGELLGTTTLDEGQVTSTEGVATETVAMLARRFGKSDAEIVGLMRDRGWSNGQVMTVHVP